MYIYQRMSSIENDKMCGGEKFRPRLKIRSGVAWKKVPKNLFWCNLNCGTKSGKSKSIPKNNWWTFNTKEQSIGELSNPLLKTIEY